MEGKILTSTTIHSENKAVKKISDLAKKKYLDRGTYMRQVENELLEESLEGYKNKMITIEELAEKNRKSLWEILGVLKQRNIPLNVNLEDIETGVNLA